MSDGIMNLSNEFNSPLSGNILGTMGVTIDFNGVAKETPCTHIQLSNGGFIPKGHNR